MSSRSRPAPRSPSTSSSSEPPMTSQPSTPQPPGDPGRDGPVSGDTVEVSPGLTHLDEAGRARMVDVAAKPVTERVAVASGEVRLAPATAALLLDGDLPKGDALPVVRLAGIQAAKRTHELIPLCHQVALTSVEVAIDVHVEAGLVELAATARATDRTGVEMEAMTAVTVAALTLYDLIKAVQRDVRISDVRLRHKSGGRSGAIDLD